MFTTMRSCISRSIHLRARAGDLKHGGMPLGADELQFLARHDLGIHVFLHVGPVRIPVVIENDVTVPSSGPDVLLCVVLDAVVGMVGVYDDQIVAVLARLRERSSIGAQQLYQADPVCSHTCPAEILLEYRAVD